MQDRFVLVITYIIAAIINVQNSSFVTSKKEALLMTEIK